MQPTMKIRILRKPMYSPSPTSTGHAPPVYQDTWQQWWEGVAHTAQNGIVKEHVYGVWRDVPSHRIVKDSLAVDPKRKE